MQIKDACITQMQIDIFTWDSLAREIRITGHEVVPPLMNSKRFQPS